MLAQYLNYLPTRMWDHVKDTRNAGYALNDGLMMPEMAAIGMGIRDPQGAVIAALSIAGLRSRLQLPRRTSLRDSLAREVAAIENAIVLRDKSG